MRGESDLVGGGALETTVLIGVDAAAPTLETIERLALAHGDREVAPGAVHEHCLAHAVLTIQ